MTNIVLIGFSGCGKTTVGKKLSEILGFAFTDTDLMLEAEAKMPVTEIFEKFGEEHFRRLEAEAIEKACAFSNAVIATGGGCVKNEENMKILAESGTIVYLKCSADKVYENIKDDVNRPLLQTDDKLKRISELLSERMPLYERYAEITVDITDCDIDEAACAVDLALSKTGVSSGGEPSVKETDSEEYVKIKSKLLLLYLIDKMDIPLSHSRITQFIIEEEYMEHFSLQQNLAEMVQAKLVDKFQDNTTIRYTILDKGQEILKYFEKRIPQEICARINKYVIDNRKTIKKDYEITANHFYDYTNNEFIVKCGVYEDETMLMEVNISVVSKEQAKAICSNWKENVKTLYGDILKALMAESETAESPTEENENASDAF